MTSMRAAEATTYNDPAVSWKDYSIELGLKPLDAILLLELMLIPDALPFQPPVLHTHAGAGEVHVKVHAVDSCTGVVLDSKIDVLADTEAKVSDLTEVAHP